MFATKSKQNHFRISTGEDFLCSPPRSSPQSESPVFSRSDCDGLSIDNHDDVRERRRWAEKRARSVSMSDDDEEHNVRKVLSLVGDNDAAEAA